VKPARREGRELAAKYRYERRFKPKRGRGGDAKRWIFQQKLSASGVIRLLLKRKGPGVRDSKEKGRIKARLRKKKDITAKEYLTQIGGMSKGSPKIEMKKGRFKSRGRSEGRGKGLQTQRETDSQKRNRATLKGTITNAERMLGERVSQGKEGFKSQPAGRGAEAKPDRGSCRD